MSKQERRRYLSEPWRKARLLARLLDPAQASSVRDSRERLRAALASDPHVSPRLLNQAIWWLKGKRAEKASE